MTGYITFSETALNRLCSDTESGYEHEQPYLAKYCQTKENFLLWLLFHEFTHLFKGFNTDNHDTEFFEEVYNKIESYGLLDLFLPANKDYQ